MLATQASLAKGAARSTACTTDLQLRDAIVYVNGVWYNLRQMENLNEGI